VLLCGRWCLRVFLWSLWKERSDGSFEDCEKILEEIKSLFFNSMYLWTVAFVFLWRLVIMISLFCLLLLAKCFLIYILLVYLDAPYAFDDISITYKIKCGWGFPHAFCPLFG
jgi:hypothetical protein